MSRLPPIKPFSSLIALFAMLLPSLACATTGISALGALADAIGILAMLILGIGIAVCLLIGYTKKDKKISGFMVATLVQLGLYTTFALAWFIEPELNTATSLIIATTLAFWLGVFYLPPRSKGANKKALALLSACFVILIINPVILSFDNYIFVDELPFSTNLSATEVTHPVFGDKNLKVRFLQTSDGALYYGDSFYGPNSRSGKLRVERAQTCAETCRDCESDCLNFFQIIRERHQLARPRAIFDFQGSNNFPDGTKKNPFALINIPLREKTVNPNIENHKATLKPVSKPNEGIIWNPSSNWLWSEVCGGGARDYLAEALIKAGADSNYSVAPNRDTIFNCAVRSRSVERIRLLADNGADPNISSWANRTDYPHPNAAYLALHSFLNLKEKKEIFSILVNINVDLNAQHSDGETLLHRVVADAYLRDRVALCELLVALGVDSDIKDSDGVTALALANLRREKLLMRASRTKREAADLAELAAMKLLLEREVRSSAGA